MHECPIPKSIENTRLLGLFYAVFLLDIIEI